VTEILASGNTGSDDDADAVFLHLLRAMHRDVPRLHGQVKKIPQRRIDRCGEIVHRTVSLLNEIIKKRGA
jgi:hypothetical protein